MWEIFKSELVRFRLWAIAYAVVHFLVLGFLTRVVDLAQQPLMVYRVFAGVYVLTGMLIGLYQMGIYRRPSTWLNLLHRPLPQWQVATALFTATAVLLMLAIALPILAVGEWQEIMTARVVDLRHWLLAPAGLLISLCAYFAGSYCMLGGKRYAIGSLVFLLLLADSQAKGFGALALQMLALLWLMALTLVAFKPDLDSLPRNPLSVAAIALPQQMAAYLFLVLLGFGAEMVWIMQGSHPNNTSTPPHGGHNETQNMEGRERMLAGLATSKSADATLLREQVALSEILGLGMQIYRVPVRNELTNAAPMEFDDAQRRVRWVFSHDSMKLEAYSLVDGRSAGTLGVGENNQAFDAPVLSVGSLPSLSDGDNVLIGGGTLYHYESESRHVYPRIRLPQGEILLGATAVGDSLGTLSDKAIYFFDGRDVTETNNVMKPRLRVPLPGKLGDLSELEMIELLDGYLISYTFTAKAYNWNGTTPHQSILRVSDAGKIEQVARREISHDYPEIYRYQTWVMSPAMHALYLHAKALFGRAEPAEITGILPIPRNMKMVAGLLLLLSLLIAIWRTGRIPLSSGGRIVWILACGVIGLPALASLWLLYRQDEKFEQARSGNPALA